MVQLLLENLLLANITSCKEKELSICLRAQESGRFIQISIENSSFRASKQELAELFYPDINRIPYLLCKQIIRDHDEFSGHIGCRIFAEEMKDGGTTVWFTLPKTKKE